MRLDRRRVLGGALALALGQPARPARAAPADTSLREAAARSGRHFGTAMRAEFLAAEPDLGAATVAECSQLTPELSMKWEAIAFHNGEANYASADALVRFARENAMAVHGHTLLWHRSIPAWAADALSTDGDWGVVARHIAATVGRYRDTVASWDVVNEPIDTGRRMDGLREGVLLSAFGPDYIRRALEAAGEAAPAARLFLNDYGLDYEIPVEKDRRYLLLKLAERLRAAGVPLHGVGIQAHLDLAKGPFDERAFAGFLADLAALGLELRITELDVREQDYLAPAPLRDRLIADHVKRYLDVALDCPAVRGVTTWGLSSRHSWLEIEPAALDFYWRVSAGQGPGPGFNRGLPFDSDMRPTPMREAILAALERRPLRV
ncbi:endo-1,4-beta-xylanase [Aureimonas flava]|uniref:endo-1,4-beta-xylanase n=1 Tax=Aureimonas flava TaxID=2320271 RepID=UPI00145A02EC|nr:endo-1,4-beta-xylanase [Aureimonas flava]